jgi:hypothetical protein
MDKSSRKQNIKKRWLPYPKHFLTGLTEAQKWFKEAKRKMPNFLLFIWKSLTVDAEPNGVIAY